MEKLTEKERQELKNAKTDWRQRMSAKYPGFQKRMWAMTHYRISHPQFI